MNERAAAERILNLLNQSDNHKLIMARLILEIQRLRKLCRDNGIDPNNSRSKPK